MYDGQVFYSIFKDLKSVAVSDYKFLFPQILMQVVHGTNHLVPQILIMREVIYPFTSQNDLSH